MFQNVDDRFYLEEKESVVLEHEGSKLYGMWHTPKGLDKFPAIVVCSGFGGQKSGVFRVYVELAKKLAERGVATLRFDYRGYGDSDGLFIDVTLKSQLEDLLLALRFLKNSSKVTKKGVLGCSLGGRIAIHGVLENSFPLDLLALWVPLVTHEQWIDLWNEKQRVDPMFKFADFNGQRVNRSFYDQFFSWQTVDALGSFSKLPLFVAYAEKDEVLSEMHIEKLNGVRASAEAETAYHFLEKCDHRLSDMQTRESLVDSTADWLINNLGDGDGKV
jgi:uncharacterized protein